MKTKTCIQCQNEFTIIQTLEGKKRNLRDRNICLNCKPLNNLYSINRELKEQNKKQCTICNTIRDLTEFNKRKSKSESYYEVCKFCKKEENYTNRKKIIEFYQAFKQELSCSKCGYNKCIAALDFHHINPDEKEYSISRLASGRNSIQAIKKEMAKCIVVCKNCHAEIHDEEKQN